jgi:hypothetical protein
MNNDWKEKLAAAGAAHDGHVTNGSLSAQERVIDQMLEDHRKLLDQMIAAFVYDLRLVGLQCLAGGHKGRNKMFQSLANRYEYIYKTGEVEILNRRLAHKKRYKE